MTALVLVLVVSQLIGSATDVLVTNGESTGYIELLVNGKEHTRTFDELVTNAQGQVRKRKKTVVWQAGPGSSIVVRYKDWGVRSEVVLVVVRYYDDNGRLIGITRPREFSVSHASWQWRFTRADLPQR